MKTFLAVIFCIFYASIFAQVSQDHKGSSIIKGSIADSLNHQPLEYATISLFILGNKKPVNGAVTDSTGKFVIDNVTEGTYTLTIEFLGYKTSTIHNLAINKGKAVIDLKKIILSSKTSTLQGVTVVGQGKLIDNRIDKLVFNAERDLTSQSGVATDVLKKVPQVSVDVDGNVELAGSSGVRFLINGKPSSAFGSNIADVLQSIPASQIKSIEVITNPGAKDDAQGLGGIINIILKKNNAQGINGNISLTAGTRMENGSFNFSAKKGKFGMNAFLSGNTRLAARTLSSSDRTTTDTTDNSKIILLQNGSNRFTRGGYQTGLSFDYDLNDYNSFSGAVSYNHFSNNSNGSTNQDQSTIAAGGAYASDAQTFFNSSNSFNFYNIDASLNYKKTFKKEDQSLEVEVNSSFGNNRSYNMTSQDSLPAHNLYYSTTGYNPATENETEIRADYTQPFNKNVKFGVGSKINLYNVSSNSDVSLLDFTTGEYAPNNFLSNDLTYHQKVYAGYAEISFPVGKLFNAKLGERYERTEITSYFSNAQQQANIPGYNTFVPSIFFSRKLSETALLKISYSKRIERPDYGDLNPYINTSDPKNLSTGNPYLKPEIGQRAELAYSNDIKKIGTILVSLFYRINDHDIQPFIVYYPLYQVGDSTYTNVAVSTRENIGRENNMGVNVFGDIKIVSKFSLRTNLFFFYRHTINVIDAGYNYNSFNYRVNMNASYQFSPTLAAEGFGNFNSARHEAQGRYPSFTTYSLAIRKQIWKKKGSIALNATNPFSKYVTQRTELFGPDFNISGYRQIPFRSIGINFTWKFGKLEFKKDKEKPNDSLNPANENG